MRTVLATLASGVVKGPVTDLATAIADVAGVGVRHIDLPSGDAVGQATRVLAELADRDTVLGVLPAGAPRQDLCWQVLRGAAKPVVLVPPTLRATPHVISRVLIPLDGTPESTAAVAGTMDLLALAGVDIVVLHVFDADTVPKFWDHPGHADQAWQAEFLARHCTQPGVRLELRSGVAGEHVLDVAAAEKVDLIALGWSKHLDGDRARTVRRTVLEADVPVMLVPIA